MSTKNERIEDLEVLTDTLFTRATARVDDINKIDEHLARIDARLEETFRRAMDRKQVEAIVAKAMNTLAADTALELELMEDEPEPQDTWPYTDSFCAMCLVLFGMAIGTAVTLAAIG